MNSEAIHHKLSPHGLGLKNTGVHNILAVAFLDRDGVINVERSYISTPDELQLYEFSAKAIKKLNQKNIPVIVVSNQSAIARGYLTLEELDTVHEKLFTELAKRDAYIDAIFYCPHLPPEKAGGNTPNPFTKECTCRKPKTGLFEAAQQTFGFDKNQVDMFMIGDSERDIIAGKSFGSTTFGVRTGHRCQNNENLPDYMCDDLDVAVNIMLKLMD